MKITFTNLVLILLLGWTNVMGAVPTITSFIPESGAIGSSITISGTNFNTTAAQNIVFFGATQALVTAATATSLTVTVPLGATYQYLSVTNLAGNLTAYSAKPFIVTLAGSITFAGNVDFTTGTYPYSVSIGDIDGDGKPDLVVVNKTSGTVSVFRNTSTSGTVSFATAVNLTTGTSPYSVSIGDIDGDGKPDLAVANYGSTSVSVFRNTSTSGNVSFATAVDFTTGIYPISVSIGDMDGDGKPDLAVANFYSNTVSVFRNTSTSGSITSSSFAAKVDFITGTSPFSVSTGDVDGDGKPDLAVANFGKSTVSVFRNTSTSGSITSGSFAAKVDFITGTNPSSVCIGDIDGDGKPDLAVANNGANTISVLCNTSTSGSITSSSFAAKVDFTAGSHPQSVSIGDIDGDGKPDLAVAN
ncbi:MAG: FG-GAP-like repeat-containing protein, partial [Mariniphaga sp.]